MDERNPAPDDFEDPRPEALAEAGLLRLDIEGFEGPIDVLLQLARDQKVDLTKISILALAEQYLDFIQTARRLRLELAADYLVMAAWLAYLKSRLLLPLPDEGSEEPSGSEMAAALRFQLQRLQAMLERGAQLMARPQLGMEIFARGEPETPEVINKAIYELSLYELLKAYARHQTRAEVTRLRVQPFDLYAVEDAIKRLSGLLGSMPEWRSLMSFLPGNLVDDLKRRSALASTFAASLELTKAGQVEMRQDGSFGPIYLRSPEQDS